RRTALGRVRVRSLRPCRAVHLGGAADVGRLRGERRGVSGLYADGPRGGWGQSPTRIVGTHSVPPVGGLGTVPMWKFEHEVEVRFCDCDPLGHVNNAVYLSYLEAARFSWWRRVFGPNGFPAHGFIIPPTETK